MDMSFSYTATVCGASPDYASLAIPPAFDPDDYIPMGYLDQLKALRKKRGLSQAKLAELLGVEQPTIQRWESGKRVPDLESLQSLARTLGVTAGTLLDGDALVSVGPTLFIKGEVAAGVWRAAAEWPESDWQ